MNKLAVIATLLLSIGHNAFASTDCGATGTREEIISCLIELEKKKAKLVKQLEEQTSSTEELAEILEEL